MAYIYGLVDPRDDKVKYVGKTVELKERFRTHIRECRKSNSPKNFWIAHLLLLGLEPELLVIEVCEDSKWKERERFWIAHYPDLKNCTLGGDGGRQSDECIEKYWVGENNPACKLAEKDIVAIRKEFSDGKVSARELGEKYKVSPGTIRSVIIGDSWAHVIDGLLTKEEYRKTSNKTRRLCYGVKNGMSELGKEDVLLIRSLSLEGMKNKQIAVQFGVSRDHIWQIVNRRRWNHI